MTDEKANVPKLRFPGFTDPWEQRRLGEVASFSKGFGYSKEDVAETGAPLFLYGRLYTAYQCVAQKVDTYAEPRPDSVFSSGNEVVTPSSGETAEDIAIASAVLSPGIMLGGGLNVILPHDCLDQIFLALSISHGRQHLDLAKRAQGKSIVHLYNADLSESAIAFPPLAEQRAIGALFRDLDSLITLHQRELDHLKLQKRGLLQKMFPKDGSNVPELRFPGFTDPWEQRRLGDVVDVRSGRDYKHLSKGDIPVYGTGGYMTSVSEALSYSADAIGIGRKGTIDSPYILKAPFWTVDTLFYSIPCQSVDLSFAFCLFLNVDWRVKDESSGVPSLSKRTIDETTVTAPSESEQRQIGALFRDLDSLITLHQRELDHLKLQKKALLQQMFV